MKGILTQTSEVIFLKDNETESEDDRRINNVLYNTQGNQGGQMGKSSQKQGLTEYTISQYGDVERSDVYGSTAEEEIKNNPRL